MARPRGTRLKHKHVRHDFLEDPVLPCAYGNVAHLKVDQLNDHYPDSDYWGYTGYQCEDNSSNDATSATLSLFKPQYNFDHFQPNAHQPFTTASIGRYTSLGDVMSENPQISYLYSDQELKAYEGFPELYEERKDCLARVPFVEHSFRFLGLPPEIRVMIYGYCFCTRFYVCGTRDLLNPKEYVYTARSDHRNVYERDQYYDDLLEGPNGDYGEVRYDGIDFNRSCLLVRPRTDIAAGLSLLRTNRLVRKESTAVYYSNSEFRCKGLNCYNTLLKYVDHIGPFNSKHITSITVDVPFIDCDASKSTVEQRFETVVQALTCLSKQTSVKQVTFVIPRRWRNCRICREQPKFLELNNAMWNALQSFVRTNRALRISAVLPYWVPGLNDDDWCYEHIEHYNDDWDYEHSDSEAKCNTRRNRLFKKLIERLDLASSRNASTNGVPYDHSSGTYTRSHIVQTQDRDIYLDGLRWMFEDGNWWEVERARIVTRDYWRWWKAFQDRLW